MSYIGGEGVGNMKGILSTLGAAFLAVTALGVGAWLFWPDDAAEDEYVWQGELPRRKPEHLCLDFDFDKHQIIAYDSDHVSVSETIDIAAEFQLNRHRYALWSWGDHFYMLIHPDTDPKYLLQIDKAARWVCENGIEFGSDEHQKKLEVIRTETMNEKFWLFVPTIRQHPAIYVEDDGVKSHEPYFEFKPRLWKNYLYGFGPGYLGGEYSLEYRTAENGEWQPLMDLNARIFHTEFAKYRPALDDLGSAEFAEVRINKEYVHELSETEIRIIRDMATIFGDHYDLIPVASE